MNSLVQGSGVEDTISLEGSNDAEKRSVDTTETQPKATVRAESSGAKGVALWKSSASNSKNRKIAYSSKLPHAGEQLNKT